VNVESEIQRSVSADVQTNPGAGLTAGVAAGIHTY